MIWVAILAALDVGGAVALGWAVLTLIREERQR